MSDDLERLKALTIYKIAYHPLYAKVCGGVKAGLVLAQLIYWWEKQGCQEFWKTHTSIGQELYMTKRELISAIEILKSLKLINHEVKGFPRKNYFIIHIGNIIERITMREIAQVTSSDKMSPLQNVTTISDKMLPPVVTKSNHLI